MHQEQAILLLAIALEASISPSATLVKFIKSFCVKMLRKLCSRLRKGAIAVGKKHPIMSNFLVTYRQVESLDIDG